MPFVHSTDGAKIHYSVTGRQTGPAVLLIQGLATDKQMWNLQRVALARKFRTIAFDNRGAGRSDKPVGPYSLQQMTDDAIAVLDEVGTESAHVIGASMGGVVAQIVGIKYRSRVRSLTLASTSCRHHQWRRELLTEWSEIAQRDGMAAMTAQAARWVIGPRSWRRLSPALGWLGPLALTRPPHAFSGQIAALLEAGDDLAQLLHRIEAPTLVVVGNQDILTPRGDAEELAERIETAELVILSGAAHGLMIEHAATFNRIMIDFLNRAEAAYVDRSSASETAAG
jgi:3-oxoadipate enol-lactonase